MTPSILYSFSGILLAVLLALVKTRRSHLIFGVAILGASVLLLLYAYTEDVPATAEYTSEVVQPQDCFFDKDKNGVQFRDSSRGFVLGREVIETTADIETVINSLCDSSQARIWYRTDAGKFIFVWAIESNSLNIPLHQTLELSSPRRFEFIGWMVFALGLFITIISFIFGNLIYHYIGLGSF